MKPRAGWGASFRYAFAGIAASLKTQRNLRFHCFAAVLVIAASLYFRLPPRDIAVLLLTIALVISLELMNTAVEAAVDLITPERILSPNWPRMPLPGQCWLRRFLPS